MLIINADDWGMNKISTDNTLLCFKNGSITSASAMVFMVDSERAAELALEHGLDAGLHLNFTLRFNGNHRSSKLVERQQRIAYFLRRNKYCSLLYNPLLKKDFEYIYNAQYEKYVHIYHKDPSHIDGHHHMHLCANMLVGKFIPKGFKIRRNFSFFPEEKNVINRFYRHFVDMIITQRYKCTDFFFSISPPNNTKRLQNIINLSKLQNVELMVHPAAREELEYLITDEYLRMIYDVDRTSYALFD